MGGEVRNNYKTKEKNPTLCPVVDEIRARVGGGGVKLGIAC